MQYWRFLFSFQGYVLSSFSMNHLGVVVDLKRDGRFSLKCPCCQGRMRENRRVWQVAYDLPIVHLLFVQIRYEALQGYCNACKLNATVHPPGIDAHAKATVRLKRYASDLCRHMPLSRVAELLPISTATIYRWDKAVLEETLPPPNFDNLRIVLVDEKAVRKHKNFVTVVMNGETGELLHMAEGKKKSSLASFFDKLTPQQIKGIEAVAMDRNGAYHRLVTERAPHATIVYDKFHIIANYHKALDSLRNEEYRKASENDRNVIKGQRFNLYRSVARLTPKQKNKLDTLFAINKNLHIAYLLKDALHGLWKYTTRGWARRALNQWIAWAQSTGLPPLIRFAHSLQRSAEHIIAYADYPITIGRLEGFNNQISRLIHRACGIRDLDYLYLKLRQQSLLQVPQR